MIDNMKNTPVTISIIKNIENSYISILAMHRNDKEKHTIVYWDPVEGKIIKLFDSDFGNLYHELVFNFNIGYTVGAIVGLARDRTPKDEWHSDTIERSYFDKNSIHQGILRIINKEDGIPVFVISTKIVGNIGPALAYYQKGNPVEIRKNLNKYNLVQRSIVAKILEGKPPINKFASYCAGDGYKAANRQHSINMALENLISPGTFYKNP